MPTRVDNLRKRTYGGRKEAPDLEKPAVSSSTRSIFKQETEFARLGLQSLIREKRTAHIKAMKGISLENLSNNHLRLLYTISRYAPSDSSNWVRAQSLMVLTYEGIIIGVFNYDYAPKSQNIQESLLFINVSQEGEDDLDDLRESGLVHALLVTTYQHSVTLAIQLTPDGDLALDRWRNKNPADYSQGTGLVNKLIYKNADGSNVTAVPHQAQDRADNPDELILVDWDAGIDRFVLSNRAGYRALSKITEIEDITYVCSPYIPGCIRNGLHVMDMPRSNHNIAVKVVEALRKERLENERRGIKGRHDNIKDDLTEILKINDVRILVGEWIPFGRNHMSNLHSKLGADKKTQGGMFTTAVDGEPGETLFAYEMRRVGNCIYVVDYMPTEHINFLADITTPEADGIVQLEEFGVHVHFDGTVMYGLEINSIMEALTKGISMDKLCRLLVDVQQDSSFLTYSITTAYQRVLMDTMSGGCSVNRDKFNFIIAESISPRFPAEKYMDSEDNQMEIQQVIGQARGAYDLAGGELLLILGSSGALLVGAQAYQYENVIAAFLALRSREMGMERFVNRLFQLGDTLQELRQCVITFTEDPGSLEKMTLLQSETLHEIINLQELLSQIIEGLDLQHSILSTLDVPGVSLHSGRSHHTPPGGTVLQRPMMQLPPMPSGTQHKAKGLRTRTSLKHTTVTTNPSISGRPSKNTGNMASSAVPNTSHERELAAALDVEGLYASLRLRCSDITIHLQGARAELDSLRHMTSYISNQEAFKLQTQVQANTRNLEDVFRANERSSSSLEIMQVILAGSLAFDILDRCSILYMSMDHGDEYKFLEEVVRLPLVWFIINFAFWMIMSYMLMKFMRYLASRAYGILTVRLTLNIPISVKGLSTMLLYKEVHSEDLMVEETGFMRQCGFVDRSKVWRGKEVKIDVVYDEKSRHLLKAYIQVPKSCGFNNVEEVQDAFFKELIQFGALTEVTVHTWKQANASTQSQKSRKMEHKKSLFGKASLANERKGEKAMQAAGKSGKTKKALMYGQLDESYANEASDEELLMQHSKSRFAQEGRTPSGLSVMTHSRNANFHTLGDAATGGGSIHSTSPRKASYSSVAPGVTFQEP